MPNTCGQISTVLDLSTLSQHTNPSVKTITRKAAAILIVDSSVSAGQKPKETADHSAHVKTGYTLGDGETSVEGTHSLHMASTQSYLPGYTTPPQNDILLLPAPECFYLCHTSSIFIITNPDGLL